jgi:hypothetical protein
MQEPSSFANALRTGRDASRASPSARKRASSPAARSFWSFLRWQPIKLLSGAAEAVGLQPQVRSTVIILNYMIGVCMVLSVKIRAQLHPLGSLHDSKSSSSSSLPIDGNAQVLSWPRYEGHSDSERAREYSSKLQQLVLEELRAQLQQSVETPGQLEWVPVVVDPRKAQHTDMDMPTLTVVSDSNSADDPPTASSSCDTRRPSLRGPAGVKPIDVVILCSAQVGEASEWQDPELICSFGVVQELGLEDDGGVGAQIRVFAPEGCPMHARLHAAPGDSRSTTAEAAGTAGTSASRRRWPALPQWHIAMLGNCVTAQRITAALQEMQEPQGSSSRVLRTVLHPGVATLASSHLTPPLPAVSGSGNAAPMGLLFSSSRSGASKQVQQAAHIQEYCTQRQLNDSQAQAVQQVVRAAVPGAAAAGAGYADVQLVQGPPGTGKTSTIGRTAVGLGITFTCHWRMYVTAVDMFPAYTHVGAHMPVSQ